jgi:hypothetical protein
VSYFLNPGTSNLQLVMLKSSGKTKENVLSFCETFLHLLSTLFASLPFVVGFSCSQPRQEQKEQTWNKPFKRTNLEMIRSR